MKTHPALLWNEQAPKQRQREEQGAWWTGMRVLWGGRNTTSPESRILTLLWMPAAEIAFPSGWHRNPHGMAVGLAGLCQVSFPSWKASGAAAGMGCNQLFVHSAFGCHLGTAVWRKPRNLSVERTLIWPNHEPSSNKVSELWEQDLAGVTAGQGLPKAELIHNSNTELGGFRPLCPSVCLPWGASDPLTNC